MNDNSATARQLLTAAWRSIAEATQHDDPTDRFDAANVAALRAAAAVVSVRAHPAGTNGVPGDRRRGLETVWDILPRIAPELAEWADFFAVHSRVRGVARSDRSVRIGQRQADDLLRDADRFAHQVRGMLLRDRTTRSASNAMPASDIQPASHIGTAR
ncbi:hypothetical protein CLV47_110127 [Antricoccus suffuscus]|uniref:SAV-6107-like HEPN domain-containing protein n=1 Tax=Antricoccus suffuscus TaxID=1629062 RepID=A0A2T0ZYG2_9ACTN|nr:SAV_6107 family HEPN domain-containing protein [Antricoccus suffuscus]PRZ41399.1 hypothetical protein CLV47_110127 [Antricoccus suffuscus]